MTQLEDRTTRRTERLPRDGDARVLLKPTMAKPGHVDGAWWPRSDDLTTELPALLRYLQTASLTAVHRVVYNIDEWATAPNELASAEQIVALDGFGHTAPTTIELFGARNARLVLLVVSYNTDAHRASATMNRACRAGNESTVDELLATATPGRGGQTGRAAALRRWRASPTPEPQPARDLQ